MTASQEYETALFILTSLAIIVAARDVILNKNGKWYKRVSWWGWFLIVISIGIFIFSFLKSDSDNRKKDSIKKHSDSVINNVANKLSHNVDSALRVRGMAYNSITKTITIIDTSRKKTINPVMDIVPDSTGIVILPDDKIRFNVAYKCVNEGIAYNIRGKIISFKTYNQKLILRRESRKMANTSLIAYGINGVFCK